ncbi:hypothetical protein IF2G_01936 [Cordyceps javanica]|nr:hypothetical protein IF2G_01936 [Cordyceps javanica]
MSIVVDQAYHSQTPQYDDSAVRRAGFRDRCYNRMSRFLAGKNMCRHSQQLDSLGKTKSAEFGCGSGAI